MIYLSSCPKFYIFDLCGNNIILIFEVYGLNYIIKTGVQVAPAGKRDLTVKEEGLINPLKFLRYQATLKLLSKMAKAQLFAP